MSQLESYLIVFNIAKNSNFSFLIRTANAFGAEVIIVGRKHFNRIGANGGTQHTKIYKKYTLEEACEFVRSRGCEVIGCEIDSNAKSVWDKPFKGSAAFMVGNEGEGLTDRQKSLCDKLVYIPQYGTAVSLNVNVAGAIVLHHYANWAEMQATPVVENKFQAVEGATFTTNRASNGQA